MNEKDDNEGFLFPFGNVRNEQDKLIVAIRHALKERKHLIIHAPTGLGKTVASLGPALKFAIENKKTVFFLTSRHTQHVIAIDTLKAIKEKFGTEFSATDIIGKKHMCIFPGMDRTTSGEFIDYCRQLREEDKCDYYTNFRKNNKVSVKARTVADELKRAINHTEKIIEVSAQEKLCPYEMAAFLGSEAKVIIGDYYYLFSPAVRDSFFRRIEKKMEDAIVIVDEAHNLPARLRSLMSIHISSFIMKRAIQEARKFKHEAVLSHLVGLQNVLNALSGDLKDEMAVTRESLMEPARKIADYDMMVEDMEMAAESIRNKQRFSFVGSVARFLDAWRGEDEGYVRVLSVGNFAGEPYVRLAYNCLDPSIVTKDAIESCHSIICMSGTLTPSTMYADLLGFDSRTMSMEFGSPFPQDNVLRMVVPDTTTKYTKRTPQQFEKIGKICADIANAVPGNSAFFFPSYSLRDTVAKIFTRHCTKKIFYEDSRMDKGQRQGLLEKFKKESVSKEGAVLLGTATGSFGEGIDLPGDFLKAVVVVGLPLNPPDVETKALIDYYNKKYGKGFDYAYTFPAITKCMQSAGRCIRSETDRGIIVFLDERFAFPHYARCFPPDYNLRVTSRYIEEINNFFNIKT
ncbi:MAG: DNA excision repair protein ERCC-2 [archaeon GW2011_AR3]|nr:MAG: DNA excision repair protein ERCC-2 [archaeon GW2011_AR3]MBS3109899.1 ATP-dependent DNA helicase [Candidatus Woesearchaeota archaeon]